MPSSDREVFDWFIRYDLESREIALLAFASYTDLKYAWVKHVEQRDGATPADADVARWSSDLPESRLIEIRVQAASSFEDAAETYLAPATER